MAVPPDVDEAARGHVHVLSQNLQQFDSSHQTQGSAGEGQAEGERGCSEALVK